MQDTVFALFLALLGLSIISMLSPGEGKEIRLIAGLCVIIAIMIPIKHFLTEAQTFDLSSLSEMLAQTEDKEKADSDYWAEFESSLSQWNTAELAEAIRSHLISSFALEEQSIRVRVQTEESPDGIKQASVLVLLSDSAVFTNPHAIIQSVENLIDCTCTVALE